MPFASITARSVPEFGKVEKAKTLAARVLVVGADGLAASALPLLAASGVGRITILDSDRVEQTSRRRQTLFDEAHQGRPKADVAAERCRALNRQATVIPWRRALSPSDADRLVSKADVVLDCAETIAVRFILNDACAAHRVPFICASARGPYGFVGGFCGTGPSLRAVSPSVPEDVVETHAAGLFGPMIAMLGAAQAQMALSTIVESDPSPIGQLLTMDMFDYQFTSSRFDEAEEPPEHFPFIGRNELTKNDVIIDLRGEADESALVHPKAQRMRPEDVRGMLTNEDRRLVLCSACGLAAWRVAETLQDTWPGEIVLISAKSS